MPLYPNQAILDQLLANKMISTTDMTAVVTQLQQQPEANLYTILVENNIVKEEPFTKAYATVLGIPYIDLRGLKIPRDTLLIIPESTAREHMIIAYEQTESELKVAMADPADRQIVEFIHKKVDRPVTIALASHRGIRSALGDYQQTIELELQGILATAGEVSTEITDLNKIAEDLPVVRITDLILKHAILQNASDIHIEPTEENVIVRYRIDGILHDVLTLPKTVLPGLIARIKVLSQLKIDEHRLPQDGRFKIERDDYKVAFRVSLLPVFDGEKIVMRLLDESGHGLTLDSIGMHPKQLEIFRRNVAKPHGMVLVTGPTGSGKTTTLYAAMKELNTAEVNISTIEDPIEYRMPRINQTQVNPKIGLTFSNGLRALVRQDPDIIMVGEIRDEETASLAVNASLTGHLVLSTLHTNSAAGALPRLLDMKVEAFLVASTTNLLVGQRLTRKLCPECRKETPIAQEVLAELGKTFNLDHMLEILHQEKIIPENKQWADIMVYQPVGCPLCSGGYKGRIGIYELLEVTPSIQNVISDQISSQQLEEEARKEQQMVTMVEDGFIKVIEGLTTFEEVLRVAKE